MERKERGPAPIPVNQTEQRLKHATEINPNNPHMQEQMSRNERIDQLWQEYSMMNRQKVLNIFSAPTQEEADQALWQVKGTAIDRFLTPEENERFTIACEIFDLKRIKTLSDRIHHARFIDPELLPKLQQQAPELKPVITGLQRRLAAEKKREEKERAAGKPKSPLARMWENMGNRTATFENCIVRGLMPSPEEVDRRLTDGEITDEQAREQREEALERERWYRVQEMWGEGFISKETSRGLLRRDDSK